MSVVLWLWAEGMSVDLVTGSKLDGESVDDEAGPWEWSLAMLTFWLLEVLPGTCWLPLPVSPGDV